MKRTRISWFYDFMPKEIRYLSLFFSYAIMYSIGVICFTSCTGIVYFAWLGLYGSNNNPRKCGTPLFSDCVDAQEAMMYLSIIILVLFLHFIKTRYVLILGFIIGSLIGVYYARSLNWQVNLAFPPSEEVQFLLVLFVVTLGLLLFLIPYLTKNIDKPEGKKTVTIAKPSFQLRK